MSSDFAAQPTPSGGPTPQQFAALRDCWLTGGSALSLAPGSWKTLLTGTSPDEGERRLVALAGQSLEVALRPARPGHVARRPDLPRLALPILPEALRPLYRYAVQNARVEITALLRFIQWRGFSVHPLDWMPSVSSENVPDLYAPWQDWVQAGQQNEVRAAAGWGYEATDELTEATWDNFYPAARRLRLKSLRRENPDRARELIAAKAGQEAAEQRLALIELLAGGLNENDAAYLQTLAGDRSGKVRAMAARLLARLARGGVDSQQAELRELADFFEVGKKGIIKRHTAITAKTLKSAAQARRRAELGARFSLMELAAALEVSAEEFIAAWQFTSDAKAETPVGEVLTNMVATTASDDLAARFAERLCAESGLSGRYFPGLTPRLDRDHARAVALKLLSLGLDELVYLTGFAEGDLVTREDILSSRAYKELKDKLRQENRDVKFLLSLLNPAAVLLTADAAEAVIADLGAASGLYAASPELAVLRLNGELARYRGEPPTV